MFVDPLPIVLPAANTINIPSGFKTNRLLVHQPLRLDDAEDIRQAIQATVATAIVEFVVPVT